MHPHFLEFFAASSAAKIDFRIDRVILYRTTIKFLCICVRKHFANVLQMLKIKCVLTFLMNYVSIEFFLYQET